MGFSTFYYGYVEQLMRNVFFPINFKITGEYPKKIKLKTFIRVINVNFH